jgi:1,2-diacylglycerol 3-alpha-glucosyltransferase
MRIGVFTDRYLPQTDGVSVAVEIMRVELEKLGHEVYILAPRPSWRYREASPRVIRFVAVKGVFFEDYLMTFYFPPQATRLIDKLNLDIVHFQTPGQIGLLGAYYAIHAGKPLITTYHTDLVEYIKHYPRVMVGTMALASLAPAIVDGNFEDYRKNLLAMMPKRNVAQWHEKIVINGLTLLHNHCDLVIAPSEKIKEQLIAFHTQSEVAVLASGIEKITTTTAEIEEWQERLNYRPSDKIIIFVGRIGTEKNLGLLIRAFNAVARRDTEAKLLIVGHGDDFDFFKDQASDSPYRDRITFTGNVEHVKVGALYGLATVLGFPSLTDTQCLVVNEAVAAGLPVVMIDKDITTAVIDGENGYFASNSAGDFSNKLLHIISDPELRQRFSKRSFELAKKVTAPMQTRKLLHLYEQTIDEYQRKAISEPVNIISRG